MKIQLIDEKFRQHKWRFILQSLLVGIVAYGVVFFIGALEEDAILGVIGASSVVSSLFITFITPSAPTAQPRRMLGGYIACFLVGILFHTLLYALDNHMMTMSHAVLRDIIAGVTAATMAFIMAVFNLEHPPAVGMAIGLVLGDWDLLTILVITTTIMGAALVRLALKPWLKDLL